MFSLCRNDIDRSRDYNFYRKKTIKRGEKNTCKYIKNFKNWVSISFCIKSYYVKWENLIRLGDV